LGIAGEVTHESENWNGFGGMRERSLRER